MRTRFFGKGDSPFDRRIRRYRNPEAIEDNQYAVVSYPRVIISEGFVTCLGVALYDPKSRVLGFAHLISYGVKKQVDEMMRLMKNQEASVRRMKAKLNGEFDAPPWAAKSDTVKDILKEKGIPVVAECLDKGIQDVIAHSATGEVEIYTYPFQCSGNEKWDYPEINFI